MARPGAASAKLLLSGMPKTTPPGGSDLGFSLGATFATLTLATAVAVFAGPRIAGAIKRRIMEADGAAQRVASGIGDFFDRLPALEVGPVETPASNASGRTFPDEAPQAGFPPPPGPPPFTAEIPPPRIHGPAGRPLYQPYCRPFRCLPREELPPVWPEPIRKTHRRRQPRTTQPRDHRGG